MTTSERNDRREALTREIKSLLMVYPLASIGAEQAKALAKEWDKDLSEFDLDVLRKAIRRHRNESSFFPTIADLRKQAEKYREELAIANREKHVLPPLSDEEYQRGKEMGRLLVLSLKPGQEGQKARWRFNELARRISA